MRPKVFLTRPLAQPAIDRLKEHTDLTMHPHDREITRAELIEGIKGQDGLLCLLTEKIDGEIMDVNPNLKVISNHAVGFDNIDIDAATARRIPVTNTPGVLTDTSADMAFALILAVARRVVEADRFVRAGMWEGWGPLQFLGTDVFGSTLGIIGMGRIGKGVAKRAQGFDMKVVYWNRTRLSPEEETRLNVVYQPIEAVLQQADFVSLNIAYNKATHHLINATTLNLMKPTAFLINTARGAVIDEKALVEALEEKRIAGAGLDVFEQEPYIEPEFLEMNNVVLLPHLASATIATRTKMAMMAVDNLLAVLEGKRPPFLVNEEVWK